MSRVVVVLGRRGPVVKDFPGARKLCVPDRDSDVRIGHFHEVVRPTHDTQPHDPDRGVLFVLVRHSPDCEVCTIEREKEVRRIVDDAIKKHRFRSPWNICEIDEALRKRGFRAPSSPICESVSSAYEGKLVVEHCERLKRDLPLPDAETIEAVVKELAEQFWKKIHTAEARKRATIERLSRALSTVPRIEVENPQCRTCCGPCEVVDRFVVDGGTMLAYVPRYGELSNCDIQMQEWETYATVREDWASYRIEGDRIVFQNGDVRIVFGPDGIEECVLEHRWIYDPPGI